MNQIEELVKDYDCTKYHELPKFMKRRVDALKKIQLDHIQVQCQYHRELMELELKYEKLFAPLYEKRAKITAGEYEPTDDECQLPQTVVDQEFDGDQENEDSALTKQHNWTEDEEKTLKTQVKGLPGFWLGCLTSTYNFNDSIEPHDRAILRHLKDIRISHQPTDENLIYKLEFLFDENPFFTNQVLTKTYTLKLTPEDKDPFSYEGFEVVKSEGCTINWHPGKDATCKTITVKQQNKNDGRPREKKKEVDRSSFFYFFKPPTTPEGQDIDEELSTLMAIDFELGEVIRQSIIPKAVLYYTGYMMEEEDELDDEEDDDDDDDDSEDDYDSENYDDSDDSNDSLNNTNNKGNDRRKLTPKKSPKKF